MRIVRARSDRRTRRRGPYRVCGETRSLRESALVQTRELLLPLLDSLGDDDPEVLLEPTAGQGQSHLLDPR